MDKDQFANLSARISFGLGVALLRFSLSSQMPSWFTLLSVLSIVVGAFGFSDSSPE